VLPAIVAAVADRGCIALSNTGLGQRIRLQSVTYPESDSTYFVT